MEAKLLKEAYVRQQSEKLKIPYDQFLAGIVIEEFLSRLYNSEFREVLWLKYTGNLQMEVLQNKVSRNLHFFVKESDLLYYKKNEVSRLFAELLRNTKVEAVHWNYQIIEVKDQIQCNLYGKVIAVKVPLKIYLHRLEKKNLKPELQDLPLLMPGQENVRVCSYPRDQLLIEAFLKVLKELELIGDLSYYMDMYEILTKKEFSGRAVEALLQKSCEEEGVEISRERFSQLLSYKSQTYMKKKWKSYLRHEKRDSPSWEEMIEMLEAFFKNIWESMCQNLIYLGDWIPELGRFIDG